MSLPHRALAACRPGLVLLVALACAAAPAAAGPWSADFIAAGPVPSPDDTLEITASVPYLGQAGTGRGYVYLAPGHAQLTNPVIAVEGFDIDNSMDWDELYTLLNQEGVVESLRTRGYDAVVLDFTDATDYIQRNTFVFTELLQQVEGAIDPGATVAVVGASMGGLAARYGLAWLESNAIPHRARTFISYDAPHAGANIPLGLQHWTDFFAGQSADAAYFRDRLNRPAARQMLAYHFEIPQPSPPAADPLFAELQADFAAVGGYPVLPRRVAFANGSGARLDQGYAAGAQLIDYGFNNILVLIVGDVWAVPDGGPATVFNGRIRILLVQDTQRAVAVTGTRPYDSAPGGWRASMTQLDTTQAPYGDIVALHANHCFVPTVSALDLSTNDLFYDVAGDPDLVAHTPFDAVYYAAGDNEEHVHISPAGAVALLAEIDRGVTAIGPARSRPPAGPMLSPAAPNPFAAETRIAFTLPRDGEVDLRVFDVAGREVASLRHGRMGAGTHVAAWDGRDADGRPTSAGVYLVRCALDGAATTNRVVRLP
jgi:hypothetical protein